MRYDEFARRRGCTAGQRQALIGSRCAALCAKLKRCYPQLRNARIFVGANCCDQVWTHRSARITTHHSERIFRSLSTRPIVCVNQMSVDRTCGVTPRVDRVAPAKLPQTFAGVLHEIRKYLIDWWPRAELNHRHTDFQSAALPTELLGLEMLDGARS